MYHFKEMDDDIIVEESEVNVVGIIPGQLKDFTNIEIESVSPKEIYLKIDGERVKGKISDTLGTTMFFYPNEEDSEAQLIACAEKQAVFEHFFTVPREEFKKPFVPSEAISK